MGASPGAIGQLELLPDLHDVAENRTGKERVNTAFSLKKGRGLRVMIPEA
jgi:hypothetical protein